MAQTRLPYLSAAYVVAAFLGSILIGISLVPRTESEIKMRTHESDPSDLKRKDPSHHRKLTFSHNMIIGSLGVLLIIIFMHGYWKNRLEKSWWLSSLPGASEAADQGLYGFDENQEDVFRSMDQGNIPDSVIEALAKQ